MRALFARNSFRKDYKRIAKRGYDLAKLDVIVLMLRKGEAPPERCRNHKLSGDYLDLWDCHVEPDWILIYDVTDADVTLIRTGTHADLF